MCGPFATLGCFMDVQVDRVSFAGGSGAQLAARLDRPAGVPRAYAIFAHCFTCSKDINAARRIAGSLARQGIAVLRFDFTGLGSSEGEFASTNFSSNLDDLGRAAAYLEENFEAPQLLIGHSLGGAAVLAAAAQIHSVKAVATIGAPSDAHHVTHNFHAHLDEIAHAGIAEVSLGGRKFTIEKQFIEDLNESRVRENLSSLKKAVLVLHSPTDETVGIENATAIFKAARQPKSFVSLDGADHLLTKESDAVFAAEIISAWATRYLNLAQDEELATPEPAALVRETHNGKFQNSILVNGHRLLADEPKSFGGLNSGPSPYDFLAASLGACTSMTLRMYFERKKVDVGTISVEVNHAKVHADDEERGGKIDQFERIISVTNDVDEPTRAKLLEIADKCPVHKTLENTSQILTSLV